MVYLFISLNLMEINGKIYLTTILTNIVEMQVCHRDPIVLNGKTIAQRIKGTPGITG